MSTDLVNLPPARNERGQLLPGHTANPVGRPPSKFVTEAMKNRLERGDADKIADEAFRLAFEAKDAVRLGAITFIKESVEGKATQQIRLEQTLDPETVQVIAALASKL